MPRADDASGSLPLAPASFHILLALSGPPLHGYAIMSTVEELSDGAVTMGPGTLYGTIKRLLDDGMIEETEDRPPEDDQRRRYYRLTGLGEQVLDGEVARLRRMISNAGARGVRPRLGDA